jgi:hypothetical protein
MVTVQYLDKLQPPDPTTARIRPLKFLATQPKSPAPNLLTAEEEEANKRSN